MSLSLIPNIDIEKKKVKIAVNDSKFIDIFDLK